MTRRTPPPVTLASVTAWLSRYSWWRHKHGTAQAEAYRMAEKLAYMLAEREKVSAEKQWTEKLNRR